VAHDTCWKPREVQVAPALDELPQARLEDRRIAAAHEVFGVHARRVRQLVVRARLDGIDRGTRVEVVERGAGQGSTVAHPLSPSLCARGTNFRSSGPCNWRSAG